MDVEGVLVGVAGCVQLAEPAQRQPEVVQAAGHIEVVRAEPGLADGQGLLVGIYL